MFKPNCISSPSNTYVYPASTISYRGSTKRNCVEDAGNCIVALLRNYIVVSQKQQCSCKMGSIYHYIKTWTTLSNRYDDNGRNPEGLAFREAKTAITIQKSITRLVLLTLQLWMGFTSPTSVCIIMPMGPISYHVLTASITHYTLREVLWMDMQITQFHTIVHEMNYESIGGRRPMYTCLHQI